jgi:hypothetical protein
VTYEDALLGFVEGRASVLDAHHVHVWLVHPHTGQEFTLTSTRVTWKDARLSILLQGKSPATTRPPLVADPAVAKIAAAPGATTVTAALEKTAGSAPLLRQRKAGGDLLLELDLVEPTLQGTWSSGVDLASDPRSSDSGRLAPIHWRTSSAGECLAFRRGEEIWSRPVPRVDRVDVGSDVHAQDASGRSLCPLRTAKAPESARIRQLIVFGDELPIDPLDLWQLDSEDPEEIEYTRDLNQASDPLTAPYVERAIGRLAAEEVACLFPALKPEDAEFRKLADEAEARLAASPKLLVTARLLKDAVVPGHRGFMLNGVYCAWVLEYGDNSGTIDFIRTTRPGVHEAPRQLFRPEKFTIRIRTALDLPLATIPVALFRNGRHVAPGGRPRVDAFKSPADPRLFETGDLEVVAAGKEGDVAQGVVPVVVASGDFLQARVGAEGLLSTDPPYDQVQVFHTPGESKSLWLDALRRAARCYPAREDLNGLRGELTDKHVESITNLSLFNLAVHPTTLEVLKRLAPNSRAAVFALSRIQRDQNTDVVKTIRVTLGDHAAMLLLRDAFIDLAREESRNWAVGDRESDVDALAARIVALASTPPWADLRIAGPDGKPIDLAKAFDRHHLRAAFPSQAGQLEEYRRGAARQAVREYRNVLQAAADEALGIADGDFEGLMRLTGYGFDAAVEVVLPRLMTLSETPPGRLTWVEDDVARVAVKGVSLLAFHARAQRKESSADTDFALAAVSVALVPVGLAGTAPRLLMLYETADLGYGAGSKAWDYWKGRTRVEEARRLQGILGPGRTLDAEREAPTLSRTILEMGASMAPAAGQRLIKALRKPPKDLERAADPLLTRLEQSPSVPQELSRMTPQEQADVAAYMHRSRLLLESSPTELSRTQQRALTQLARGLREPSKGTVTRVGPEPGAALRVEDPAPAPSRPWRFRKNEDGSVDDLELGEHIDSGALAHVYDYGISQADGIPEIIKVLRDNPKFHSPEQTLKGLLQGDSLLREAREKGFDIPHLPIRKHDVSGSKAYVVQERFIADGTKKVMFESEDVMAPVRGDWIPKPYADASKKFTADHQRAVVRLYKTLADADLVWLDGHIRNLYFFRDKRTGEWAAGILDQDMIVRYADVRNGTLAKGIQTNVADMVENPGSWDLRGMSDPNDLVDKGAHFFMRQMFERHHWLNFRGGQLQSALIDPGMVDEAFGAAGK